MTGPTTRLQSAMEFLLTYGWAILIIIVVLATLYQLGIFKQGSTAPNICALPADIGCISAYLSTNGILTVNLQQATEYTINANAIGCNNQGTPSNMVAIAPPNGIDIPIGGNATFSVQCYTTASGITTPFNGPIGDSYRGYLIFNYTDLTTGFTHTASGTLIETIS